MSKPIVPLAEEGSLALYLREIGKLQPLSSEKEAHLAALIHKGDQASLDILVKANLRFVVSVARNYQNQGLSLCDLINEGNVGLVRAARRFDEKEEFPLYILCCLVDPPGYSSVTGRTIQNHALTS